MRLRATLGRLGATGTIRLAGFDDLPEAVQPGYVTVRQPCEKLAAVAVEMLVSRIKNPRLPVRTAILPHELVEY